MSFFFVVVIFMSLADAAGQLVTSEILMASESGCPIEMHKIDIEKCDEMYDAQCTGHKFMPFHRAWYDHKTGQSPNSPREQVHTHTHINNISLLFIHITRLAQWLVSLLATKVARVRSPPQSKAFSQLILFH